MAQIFYLYIFFYVWPSMVTPPNSEFVLSAFCLSRAICILTCQIIGPFYVKERIVQVVKCHVVQLPKNVIIFIHL